MRGEVMGYEGFSLFEVLIAATISIVAMIAIFNIMLRNNSLSFQQSQRASLGVDLNNAVNEINNGILLAQAVSVTCPSPTPCPQSFTTSTTTLVLKLPYLDSAGTLSTTKNDYLVITQDAAKPNLLKKYIYLYDSGSSRKAEEKVLAANLSKISFIYFNESNPPQPVAPVSAAKINFVINLKGTGVSPEISSASGQLNLRNN